MRFCQREVRVLLLVGLLFLPGIPAYIWFWPRVTPETSIYANVLVYIYVLVGTFWIGLKYYSPKAIGLNRNGIIPALGWGGLVLLGRTLVILAMDWGWPLPALRWGKVLVDILFYFGFVALTEELLFRGLIYRALLDLRGSSCAIGVSSIAFALWHVFGQGPLIGLAMLLYGWIFALIRWRAGLGTGSSLSSVVGNGKTILHKSDAGEIDVRHTAETRGAEMGGILGLVIIHGLIDFIGIQMLPSSDVLIMGKPEVPHPWMMILGLGLIGIVPIGLWHQKRRITRANFPVT